MSGSWDDFFDWNHDGKLDAFEQAVKLDFLLDEWETDTSEDSDSLYGSGRSFGRSRVSGYAGGRSYTHGRSGRTTVGRKQTVSTASNTGTTALAGRQKSAVQEEKDAAKWLVPVLFLMIICLLTGYWVYGRIKHSMDRKAAVRQMESNVESFKQETAELLPEYCKDIYIPVRGTYTAEGKPEIEETISGSYQFYDIKLNYAVTLQVSSSFDKLADRSKYEALCDLNSGVREAFDRYQAEHLDSVMAPEGEIVEKLFIYYKDGDGDVYIQSPEHLYQYSVYYEDLFFIDGENCFLMDEKSKWNRRGK